MADAQPTKLLTGLIGQGIQGSKSPFLHMEEARALGLDLAYEILDLDRPPVEGGLAALLDYAQGRGFLGVNVTHPCKQDVIALLDRLPAETQALGAVNTVVFRDGERIGHNTDWWGFAESFRRGLPGADLSRVVQLGAGGAGAAVAYATLILGAEALAIFDLDRDRAGHLAEALGRSFGGARVSVVSDVAAAVAQATGLINATPIGMAQYPGLPLSKGLLRPEMWVSEVVYVPLETELLKAARAIGCRTCDGGGMVVFQAAEAFRLFTGVTPDAERMLASFARARPLSAVAD